MNTTKAPIIEIHGTGTHNRGAELMAIAISERILLEFPNAKITVPGTFGFPNEISKYGFYTNFELDFFSKRAILAIAIALFKGKTVLPNRINIILDASGFAFSDQWGEKPAQALLIKANKSIRSSQSLILMPQALGSFHDQHVKKEVQSLFARADLVFARDVKSFQYADDIINHKSKLNLSPDFTIMVKPKEKKDINLPKKFVGIVPNLRMLDKSDQSQQYLNFLREAIQLIKQNGLRPVFIIHDGKEDLKVIPMLGQDYMELTAIQDDDPRVLKWILGQAQFVVGSRFHALVSTMSQGVPCIGAGWSHKYPELFADFANKQGLIEDLEDLDALKKQISILSDPNMNSMRSEQIRNAAESMKGKVDHMWNLVIEHMKKCLETKL